MEIGLLLFCAVIYFLPWAVAAMRSHHQSGAIFALNLFLGWTLLGWVVAFIWACTATKAAAEGPIDPTSGLPLARRGETVSVHRYPAAAQPQAAAPPSAAHLLDELERLARLKAEGALNDEEFAALKAKAMAAPAPRTPAPDAY